MSVERAVAPSYAPQAPPRTVRRPPLRSVPASSRSPRAPFVVLVLLVLGMGLIGLLLLNTSLQQGSFVLEELQTQAELLRDRQSTLTDEVAGRSAPDALAHQAVQLGMVTAEAPLFLEVPENARGSANGAR